MLGLHIINKKRFRFCHYLVFWKVEVWGWEGHVKDKVIMCCQPHLACGNLGHTAICIYAASYFFCQPLILRLSLKLKTCGFNFEICVAAWGTYFVLYSLSLISKFFLVVLETSMSMTSMVQITPCNYKT